MRMGTTRISHDAWGGNAGRGGADKGVLDGSFGVPRSQEQTRMAAASAPSDNKWERMTTDALAAKIPRQASGFVCWGCKPCVEIVLPARCQARNEHE